MTQDPDQTLILASRSAARRALLQGAGLAFELADAGVDEAALKAPALARGDSPKQIAEALACQKALAVSRRRPGLVIGADQTLDLDGRLIDKADSPAEGRARLLALRGRSHQLHSAVALARGESLLWTTTVSASLTLRPFSEAALEAYLAVAGDALTASVGAYRLEGPAIQLFEAVQGDYFTILGLPLLPLLAALRDLGHLAP